MPIITEPVDSFKNGGVLDDEWVPIITDPVEIFKDGGKTEENELVKLEEKYISEITALKQQYKDKIDVLISLDFEIPNLKPKRIIDLKCGYVIYHKTKYPHKLFIYEFNRPHKH